MQGRLAGRQRDRQSVPSLEDSQTIRHPMNAEQSRAMHLAVDLTYAPLVI
jgi:hypothetical protein